MVNQSSLSELALFAGAGGGILGGKLLGWKTVCAVEIERYQSSILCARQNEGLLEPFPVWDDIRTFDGKPWRGIVDVISGGFPCQDISAAGTGKGIQGERSGLWGEMQRIISEVRPSFVFVENSPLLTSRGLGTVIGDLASLGYNAEWGVLGGRAIDISTKRERIWILAYANNIRWDISREREVRKTIKVKSNFPWKTEAVREDNLRLLREQYTDEVLSRAFRGTDNMACRVDRLKAIGNGQIPAVAATAWNQLLERAVNNSIKI